MMNSASFRSNELKIHVRMQDFDTETFKTLQLLSNLRNVIKYYTILFMVIHFYQDLMLPHYVDFDGEFYLLCKIRYCHFGMTDFHQLEKCSLLLQYALQEQLLLTLCFQPQLLLVFVLKLQRGLV